MRGAVVSALCASMLAGCVNQSGARMGLFSATAPVIAILQDDLFTGEAVGYLDQTGTINVRSSVDPNVRCIGRFEYLGISSGAGTMQCNDGVTAKFSFNALSSLSGYGFGTSPRGPLSFTFGLTPEEAEQYLKLPQGKRLKKQEQGLTLTPV